MTTLAEKLILIDTSQYLNRSSREIAQRRLLDEAKKIYPSVDKAVKGELSFVDVVEKLYEKYKGSRLFLPRFKDKGYDEWIDEELHELFEADIFRTEMPQRIYKRIPLGRISGWFYEKLANPLTAPLFFGGFAALINSGQGEYEIAKWFGIGAFAGLVYGFIGSVMTHIVNDISF